MSDPATKSMNVLLVLSDQHHAGTTGYEGHPQAITPNMDRLAREGTRFRHAYAQNPICTPSRVSIASGQYCHNHGYYGLSGPTPHALPNIFRHFRGYGYRTAAIGKLHFPDTPRSWIADDVDLFADTYETPDGEIGDSAFFRELEQNGLRELEDSWHNRWNYGERSIEHDARPSMLPYEYTQEVWSARQAMNFVDQAPDQPFFIEVAFQKPHHPLLPQAQFWDLYPGNLDLPPTFEQDPSHRPPHFQHGWKRMRDMPSGYGEPGESYRDRARRTWRGTLACITQVDDVLGRLMRFLDERGLAGNTIVIYGSDHGCYHTIQGLPEKAPGICSEAVCRVPMIWRVPGATRAGHESRQLVENVDYAPTLCSLCDLPPMDTTDGRDLTGLLRGEEQPARRVAVTENPWSKSIRWGPWRMVHYQQEMFEASHTENPEGERDEEGGDPNEEIGELYDIERDPDETTNLYYHADYQPIVQEGRRRLLDWLIRTTRVTTCQPASEKSENDGQKVYHTAGDGRESNDAGPALRIERGQINYI